MLERRASRTALATANMRAAHQLFDPRPRILEDPFALPVIGEDAVQRIKDTVDRYQTVERRGFRAHIVLRSRFAEDRLEAAVRRGITQYVILGAGFDTFALRQPAWARGLKIIEVDHPGTQELKRSRMIDAGLEMPGNAGFGTIDFERESLRDGLARYGLSTSEPTFFSCLGVTMYLKEESVDAMLGSVAVFPRGSEIVLTYAPPPRDPTRPSRSALAERAASVGEPWLSYFDEETLGARLGGLGFSRIEPLSPADAGEKYFRPHPGDLPVPRRTYILSAVL
jgi:methyltransferase (TIGR00027 family)